MGAALIIVPVFIVIAALIWVTVGAGKTSQARKAERTLPDEPDERRQEEIRRLKQEHADAQSPHAEI